jgi:hypothetical protein
MVTISQIKEASRKDAWPAIEWLLKRGGRPKLDDLLKALGREESIPPRTKAHIASLLNPPKKQKRTGRKAVPDGEDPEMYKMSEPERRATKQLTLLFEIQWLASELKEADPMKAAIQSVAKRRGVEVGTVRRDYLKACKDWPEAANGPHEI